MDELITAIITSAGTVLAALVGVLVWQLSDRSSRRAQEEARRKAIEDDENRKRTVNDILRALRAELKVLEERGALEFSPENRTLREARLREQLASDAAWPNVRMPVGVPDVNFVFEQSLHRLELLPSGVIDSIVRAYRYDAQLNRLVDAFGGGLYDGLSLERRADAIGWYFQLGETALNAVTSAVQVIDTHLKRQEQALRDRPDG